MSNNYHVVGLSSGTLCWMCQGQHSVNTGMSPVLTEDYVHMSHQGQLQEKHHQLNHTVTQSTIPHKYKHTNICLEQGDRYTRHIHK